MFPANSYIEKEIVPLVSKLAVPNLETYEHMKANKTWEPYLALMQAGTRELQVHDNDLNVGMRMARRALGLDPPETAPTPNLDKAVQMLVDAGDLTAPTRAARIKHLMRDPGAVDAGIERHMNAGGKPT